MSTNSVKKVLVTGCTGYVGNYLLKAVAKANPAVACVGMSRRGTARKGETETGELENVSYLSGNCLHTSSFENELADTDAVIHAVGTLFQSSKPELTYKAMNTDSCINMATILNQYAKEQSGRRNFVMISSMKPPFFAKEYQTSKDAAQRFLLEECPNLKTTVIRPGVVVDMQHRAWSVPVAVLNDIAWWSQQNIDKKIMPEFVFNGMDFLYPARST